MAVDTNATHANHVEYKDQVRSDLMFLTLSYTIKAMSCLFLSLTVLRAHNVNFLITIVFGLKLSVFKNASVLNTMITFR